MYMRTKSNGIIPCFFLVEHYPPPLLVLIFLKIRGGIFSCFLCLIFLGQVKLRLYLPCRVKKGVRIGRRRFRASLRVQKQENPTPFFYKKEGRGVLLLDKQNTGQHQSTRYESNINKKEFVQQQNEAIIHKCEGQLIRGPDKRTVTKLKYKVLIYSTLFCSLNANFPKDAFQIYIEIINI